MRKSFTWFLSLLVLLSAFTLQGYGQAQKTVELYAEDASSCYKEANDYTVNIAVKDFIKLTSFDLNLVFNDDVFNYEGVTGVNSSISAVTVTAGTDGVINLKWNGSEATIGDNVKTNILTLHFSVLGFPGSVAPSLTTDLAWGTTEFYYTNTSGSQLVNTDNSTDGSLTVNALNTEIVTSVTTETCAGGNVTLSVTAPTGVSYLFNEGPTPTNWVWTASPNYQVTAGDVVTVRVKDASGCMSLLKTVVVPESVDPVSFTVSKQDPACYGANGSVVVNASGGVAPYTYYINTSASATGATPKTNFQWAQAPGTYYVAVQDANGCANLADAAYWKTITITDNNTVIAGTITPTSITCNGANNGSLAITLTEGGNPATGVYQVSLNNGAWAAAGTYTFNNLAAGTYTVRVRNSSGCIVQIGSATITQPAAIAFNVAVSDVDCGAANTGQIAVTNITGGTSPYDVTIQEGTNVTTQTDVTSATFTGLKPTYYSLTITDANGCVRNYSNPNGTGNVIAVQSPAAINYKVVITDPACNNETASVAITNVTGGTGTYKYSFNGGTTWVDTTTVAKWNYLTTPLNIVVRNSDGTCAVAYETLDATDVDNPDVLTASVSQVFAPTCIDGNDGNIYLNISGGVKPYEYSINGGAWRASTGAQTIVRVGVGTHLINVRDSNHCEIATEISQTVTLAPNTIDATSDLLINCFGDKTGTISVAVTSWAEGVGTRALSYYVENSAGVVSSFFPSNHVPAEKTATAFAAGKYVIWAVDQYTCESNTDTVIVKENPELMIQDVVANGASCFGTFEGTITIHATGGNVDGTTTKLEYAVVNNQGALGNITDDKWLEFTTYNATTKLSTVSFQVDAGTYWIAVRDNDCDEKTFGPIVIEGYEELLVKESSIVKKNPLCFEDANGTITVPLAAVTGGAGAYKFTLLDNTGKEVTGKIDQATGEFTGLAAGTYQVLVEDAENCPSYTTANIVLTQPTELTFTTDFQHISCKGANNGTITVAVSGGTAGYSYAVNNQNTWIPFGKDVTTKVYIATEPGTFNVWVKDANGCIAGPQKVTIKEPAALSATVKVDNNALCYGSSTGQITVTGKGGWAGITSYEFKVNKGSWAANTTIGSLPAGTHKLYVRDAFAGYNAGNYDTLQVLSCIDSVSFTITSPEAIVYDVTIDEVKCRDGADGSLTVQVLKGGTAFKNKGFEVRVTGPSYSKTDFTGSDKVISFTGLEHGIYTVYITDSLGCSLGASIDDDVAPYSTIESWEVAEPDTYLELKATFKKNASCFGSEDGQFTVAATGGTAPYKYYAGLSVEPNGHVLVPSAPAANSAEWQDTTLFNVGAGTWVVWVMDANGCILGGETNTSGQPVNDWRVRITQPTEIKWAFHTMNNAVHYVQPACYGASNGQIHLVNITGGTAPYNAHVWGKTYDGETIDTVYSKIKLNSAGTLYALGGVPASDTIGFFVTVMDSLGCESAVDTIVVKQPKELTVDLSIVEGTTCAGAVEGVIEAVANGGTGSYQYQLLKNGVVHTPWQGASSTFIVQIGNDFTVQVRDANGCQAEDSIYMETPLDVTFDVMDLSCYGDAKASLRVTAEGTVDREFRVIYREVENDIQEEPDTTAWFTGSVDINNAFTFDNENINDVHYEVWVEDDAGCKSLVEVVTFDAVQSPISLDINRSNVTECTEDIALVVSGGVGPYTVMVNDSVLTNLSYTLPRGEGVVRVMDAHMCEIVETVVVTGNYVTRDTTIETFIGHKTEFVDAQSGVDTTLAVGTHEFVYDFEGCERTLNVTVVAVARPLTIAEVQGTGNQTTWMNQVVEVTGTVTGVSVGEGFFMQDANAAWSGIWVAYGQTSGIAIGDGVVVTGKATEIASVTTIDATEVEEVDAVLTVEPVVLENPLDVDNEMYESVLVTIEGARAAAMNQTTGEWKIYYEPIESAIVNDLLYRYVPVDSNFYHVSGIVNARLDQFKIEPRMESDIVNVTETTGVKDNLVNAFRVYPNPFNDRISIENNDKLTRVVISNIAGQRVIDVEYPSNEIRTANLVSGVYIISLYTESGIAKSERIVKR